MSLQDVGDGTAPYGPDGVVTAPHGAVGRQNAWAAATVSGARARTRPNGAAAVSDFQLQRSSPFLVMAAVFTTG